MKIIVLDTPEDAAERIARGLVDKLARKPDLVLGLATGSTPIQVYAHLIRSHESDGTDFSRVTTFNLDEYLGLPPGHQQSYRRFMDEHLFDRVNIPDARIHFPPTQGPDLEGRCREYEEKIAAAGGIDVQILGIGSNGHIGFNEPTSSLASRTRIKTLAEKTLRDNARFYRPEEKQPQLASTMGIGTILDAREIVLQAFGAKKAAAIRATVEGPVSSMCPGSALQLHPAVSLFLDPASASRLQLLEYYRKAQHNDEVLRQEGQL